MVQFYAGNHDAKIAGNVSGFGGLQYGSPQSLDKKYWGSANTGAVQYLRAAQQILQGAEGADAAMMNAYRDIYRARLGGAAAGQRQYIDQQASQAAGMGLSPDLVQRLIAARQAQQSQMLGATHGELQGQYGMRRAALLQGTGNSLANLLVDETKFAKDYAAGRRGANNAAIASTVGAVASVAGAAFGAPALVGAGLAAGAAGGGGGGGQYGSTPATGGGYYGGNPNLYWP